MKLKLPNPTKRLGVVKNNYIKLFILIFLPLSFSNTFAQSTNNFFGMNYWEYAEYSPGQVTDLFKSNINEISTWNLGIIRIGGNYNNTTKNDPYNDKDWYVTAIVNAKSIGGIPLVQLPIDLTATQVGEWMDYFNVTKKLGVIYWGIGNEPDPSSNFEAWYANTATADGRTFQQWAAQFKTIATKIKQKDVNSIICGPDFRHWWGTTTTGAFGTWYKDFLYNGANAVCTATYNGDPLVDIFAFHFYGDGGSGNFDEGEISTKYATMMTLINSTNALRPASQPLKVAVGEYQDNLNYSTYPFRVGQRLAIMSKQSLKNNAVYIAPWSLSEGYGWSMISKTSGNFYSTAHHYKMMGQNKRDNFMTGEINNNNNYDIVEFGMQDANGYTIMLMNENTTTDFSYAVKFSTTAGDYSTKTGTIKFRFNADKSIDFNGTLAKASTLLFTFDSNGNMLKKMEYKSTDTNGPVTTPYNVNAAPTVSITAPVTGTSVASGTAITISANAADTAPGTVASVSFYDGATLLATDTTSPYSYSWTNASTAVHTITAKATDNNGAVTTSAAVTITVSAANTPPTVSITAPVTGTSVTSGTAITISANAADAAPGTVTSVSFYDGATLLATDTTSPYSYSWTNASVASHTITAKATDNNGAVTTSAAVTVSVTAVAPQVAFTNITEGQIFAQGFDLTPAATATHSAGITGVKLYLDNVLIREETVAPYDWGWSVPADDALATLSVGNHILKALATSTQGSTAEAIVNIAIQAVNVAPTVNITAPVTGTSVTSGTAITISANAADTAPGTVTSVSFYDGATLLGTDTTSPYSYSWTNASTAAHTLTAKATDNNGTITTSAAVTITVNAANTPPTVSITAPVTGTAVTYGATITLTANAADTAPGTVTSVAFYDGATLLGTDTTSPYSYSWLGASTGTHSITAKATDNNNNVTTSTVISITVNPVNNLYTASYFHLVNRLTSGFMRPTAGSNTAYVTQYQEATGIVPTLDSYDWEFIAAPVTGYYYIVNKFTGKAIKPTLNTKGENVNLSQTDLVISPSNTELQWAIETTNEANYYYIRNRYSDKCIRPMNGTGGTGIEIVQNTLNTAYSSFKWNLANPESKPTNAKIRLNSDLVSETELIKTSVYPNPASEFISVLTTVSEIANVTISIYNITGTQISSQEFKSVQGNFEQSINIAQLPAGTYILKINKGVSKGESIKFIKK